MVNTANERKKSSEMIGRRVQVPAYTDAWMKGDRYGKVTAATLGRQNPITYLHVLMDKSGKIRKFISDDCDLI